MQTLSVRDLQKLGISVKQHRRKYRNEQCHVDGYLFDSKAEARRYGELKMLEMGGHIIGLRVHPVWKFEVNGVTVGSYEADFAYQDQPHLTAGGTLKVEDVKSEVTERLSAFQMKRKLMKALYGIDVEVVK